MVTVEKPFSWNRPLDVRWPQHTRHRTRLPWLSACCAVAEGADVQPGAVGAVAAVLRDGPRRVALCGGREGMPRSLASVYAAIIALFQSELRPVRGFVADTGPQQQARGYGVSTADNFAVSRDGTTLFLCRVPFDNVFVFDVASGTLREVLPPVCVRVRRRRRARVRVRVGPLHGADAADVGAGPGHGHQPARVP
jgi:hypothetical protein